MSGWIPEPPEEPDLSTWWRRLNYTRREIGERRGDDKPISVNQMAQEMGYSPSTLATWLRGTPCRNVLQVIQQAQDVFGVERDWTAWGEP